MTGVIRPPSDETTSDVGVPGCPYRGLEPYTEREAAYFFGRDHDRDLVVANLMASRLTLLFGASGVGKSSLLRAGVIRELRGMSDDAGTQFGMRPIIVAYHASWRDDPLIGLAAALRDALPDQLADDDLVQATVSLSVELLQHVTTQLDADVVLVCDQFEEVMLYQTGAARDVFAAELGRIIAAMDLRVAIVIGIRDDAIARLDRFEADIPNLFDNLLRLDHLDLASAREAISRPVERYNTEVPQDPWAPVEPELIDALLEQLRTGYVSVVEIGRGGVDDGVDKSSVTIETPFLQLVMTKLWYEEVARGSRKLRRSTLDELGGAEQIVRTHLDSVMSKLSEDQQKVAARIFRHLVTRSGVKIAYTAGDLAYVAEAPDPGSVTEVLERLSAGRERVLRPVPPVNQTGAPRYEIFHDVMAPAVLDWRRQRERAESERALVRAKREAEKRERESRRRLRMSLIFSAALAVLLLLVLGLGFATWVNGRAVQRQQQIAEYEKNLDSDPAASLDAALQAWRKKPLWQKHSADAERAVRNALDANRERIVLDAGPHRNVVTSQFTPDGQTVLTVRDDGMSAVFGATTGDLRHRFTPPGDRPRSPLTGASLSPDGSMVVTAASNGRVLVYDVRSGRRRVTLAEYRDPAFATWARLRGRPVVLTYSRNGTPALWDPAVRNPQLARYGTPTSGTRGADLSPDGRYVVTIGSDRRAWVWEAASGRPVASSPVLGIDAAQPLFVTAGSGRVAVVTRTQEARSIVPLAPTWQVVLWDWRRGGAVLPILSVRFSERQQLAVTDDRRLLAAALGKSVILIDAETGKSRGSTPEARDRVTAVDFSANGQRLVVGDLNGSAVIWNTVDIEKTNPSQSPNEINSRRPRPVAELLGSDGSVSDAQFNPHDPSTIVTTGSDGKARIWKLPNQTIQFTPGSSVFDADVSQDGKSVVTAEGGWLRVWRSDNGALEREWSRPREQFWQAVFTPDAAKIVANPTYNAYSPLVWTWRTNDWNRLEKNDGWITHSLAVSPDGRTVAAGDYSNRVIVWNLNTGKITGRLGRPNTENEVRDVAYIGSTRLAVASSDGTVRIWDLRDSRRPTPGETKGITAIAVSRDGSRLATATEDRRLLVWDVSDGQVDRQPEAEIPAEVGTIKDVAFSRDGKLLAAGVADGTVHMWRWRDSREIVVLPRHSEAVASVEFTADDRVLTVGDDKSAVVFPCTACKPFSAVHDEAEHQNELLRKRILM